MTLKRFLRRLAIPFKAQLEPIAQMECRIAAAWASNAHHRLMLIQWGLPPPPEHFNYRINLFYQWLKTRSSMWLERGVFNSLALLGGNVLELSCGDGFNARNFYAAHSKRVVACDFDPKAIATARRENLAPNVEYVLCDIREAIPQGRFENIVWDAAIEHFTYDEIQGVLHQVKERLLPGGRFSGYTIAVRPDAKAFIHHEYEFHNKEELLAVLQPFFVNVTIFETHFPERDNLYWWASDGSLPFRERWERMLCVGK
jgi:SAM-dependent methyltransferase